MGTLVSVRLIRWLVSVYDFVTLPFYYLYMQPWKERQLTTRERARRIDERTWVNMDNDLKKAMSSLDGLSTLDELFRESVRTYGPKRALGVRKILAVEREEGRVIKHILDDKYTWLTYSQIETIVARLARGLHHLGPDALTDLEGARKVLIAADTCRPWFLFAHACFRINVTVATAYTTLDDAAILHLMNETGVKVVTVSQKFVQRLYKLLPEAPLIHTVIILDEPLPGDQDAGAELARFTYSEGRRVQVLYYAGLQEEPTHDHAHDHAHANPDEHPRPAADDVAILMYTSGSTGLAKGVMLTHKNIVYTAISFSGPGDITHRDRYIGYLPLGHVLELAAECIFMRNGSTIGYSSPLTLTDRSPLIKRGQRGDCSLFRPTIMGTVPLVLERMKRSIELEVKERGQFAQQLIQFVQEYKTYWQGQFYTTPIMNRLVCRPFQLVLGGELRAACSGGAPLAPDTHRYLRQVMNINVIQGYGLTETSAAASFCDPWERRYGVVGAPYPYVVVRLEDWSDYTIRDKPHPRGEIVIGGQPVSLGYYKQPELTRESYYVDPDTQVRFFRTGDIGQMLPDGVLQIIDRKKDIVKPASGEYISLVAVESVLASPAWVDNVCVHCSQTSNYLVALVRPNHVQLVAYLSEMLATGKLASTDSLPHAHTANGTGEPVAAPRPLEGVSLAELCSSQAVSQHVMEALKGLAKQHKLKPAHMPARIKLVAEEWTPDLGLITATFKLRRREIEKFYAADIKQMYESLS